MFQVETLKSNFMHMHYISILMTFHWRHFEVKTFSERKTKCEKQRLCIFNFFTRCFCLFVFFKVTSLSSLFHKAYVQASSIFILLRNHFWLKPEIWTDHDVPCWKRIQFLGTIPGKNNFKKECNFPQSSEICRGKCVCYFPPTYNLCHRIDELGV